MADDKLNISIDLSVDLDKSSLKSVERELQRVLGIREEVEKKLSEDLSLGKINAGDYEAQLKKFNAAFQPIRKELRALQKEAAQVATPIVDGVKLLQKELGFGKKSISKNRLIIGQYDTKIDAESLKLKNDIADAYKGQARKVASGITQGFLDEFSNFNFDDEIQVAMQDFNDFAASIGKMVGLKIEKNVSEVTGQPDFARPEYKVSGKVNKNSANDFIQSGGKTFVSPVMIVQALEKVVKKNPAAVWPADISANLQKFIDLQAQLAKEKSGKLGERNQGRIEDIASKLDKLYEKSLPSQTPSKFKDPGVMTGFDPADAEKTQKFLINFDEGLANATKRLEAAFPGNGKTMAGDIGKNIIESGLGSFADKAMSKLMSIAASEMRGELKKAMQDDPQFNAAGHYGAAEFENMRRYVIEKVQQAADEIERAKGLVSGSLYTLFTQINSAKYGKPYISGTGASGSFTGSNLHELGGSPDPRAAITMADVFSMVASRGTPNGVMPSTDDLFAKVFEDPNLIGSQTSRNIKSAINKMVNEAVAANNEPYNTWKSRQSANDQKQYAARMNSMEGDKAFYARMASRDPMQPTAGDMARLARFSKQSRGNNGIAADTAAYERMAAAANADPYAKILGKVEEMVGGFISIADLPLDAQAEYIKRQAKEVAKAGEVLTVAIDTEFNKQLSENITEAAASFKNAKGQFVKVLSFAHTPNDVAAMRNPNVYAQNPKDMEAIAKKIGYPIEQLRSMDPIENNQMFAKKVAGLVDLVNVLNSIGVPVSGNSLSAENTSIKAAVEHVKKTIGKELNFSGFANTVDYTTIAKKVSKTGTSDAQLLTTGNNQLQNLMENAFKFFPEMMKKYSDVVRLGDNGKLQYKTQAGKTAPGHVAEVDTIATLIVSDLFTALDAEARSAKIVSDESARLIVENISNSVDKAASSSGGAGEPPVKNTASAAAGPDEPNGGKAEALKRQYNSEREMLILLGGLSEKEKRAIQARIESSKNDAKQIEIAASLIEVEKKLVAERTKLAEMRKAAIVDSKIVGPRGVSSTKNAAASLATDEAYLKQKDAVAALINEQDGLINSGKKLEEAEVSGYLSKTRYKDMQEKLTQNTRKQIDAQLDEAHTTRGASAVIKQQMQEQVQRAKEVQAANKALISSWVTARYALYDVANAYQNVSRNMFFAAQRILQMTSAYRSYETAFTSVERAMQLLPSNTSLGFETDEVRDLKNQFVDLANQLPISFEELSKIATLGAQMGVSAQGIESFTKTVAEFSAVTNVSADTVAQSFGRIAELANVDYSNLENLGSAISFAGVNAVATDSEIMNLSESIAAVSNMAGFMPGQVVGMGTALASVGIQSEQARGVFTRVFADIDRAVSQGGTSLDNFAKLAGMSSEDFKAAWGKEGASYDVFRSMLGGLKASGDMTKAFDSLNIKETREINTLTRLAENLNVVDQSMSDATSAYESGIFLSQSFEKTTDNLDSKIVMFQNSTKALTEELSRGLAGALSKVLDAAVPMVEWLQGASKSMGSQLLGPIALFGTVAVGGLLAVASAGKKVIAQIYAMRVAALNSPGDMFGVKATIQQMKELSGLGSVLIEKQTGLASAAAGQRGEIAPASVSINAFTKGEQARQDYLLKTEGIYAALGDKAALAEGKIQKASDISKISSSERYALAIKEARAVEYGINMRSMEVSNIEGAISAEKAAAEAKIQSVAATEMDSAARSAAIQQINAESGATIAGLEAEKARVQNGAIYLATIDGEIRAINAKTLADLENTIATKAAGDAERIRAEQTKASIVQIEGATTAANMSSTKMAGGWAMTFARAVPWIMGAVTAFGVLDSVITGINEANKIDLLASGGGLASLRDALKQDTLEWQKTGNAVSTTTVEYEDFSAKASDVRTQIAGITGTQSTLGAKTDEITSSVKEQTIAIGQNTKEWMLNAIIGNEKVQQWLKDNPGLFKQAEAGLNKYGTSFSNILNMALSDPVNGAANAVKVIDDIASKIQKTLGLTGGVGKLGKGQARQQYDALLNLKTLITEVGGAFGQAFDQSTLVKGLASALGITTDEAEKLAGAVDNVAAKVKTLTQWAGDLSGMMQSAFDFKFGRQAGYDAIVKKWRDIKKQADEAKKAVKKAEDTINSLKADRAVLEYQLNVAVRYGDDIRANKIRAELAKNTEDTTTAQEELKKAQDATSTELKGNTDAAIDNRAKMRELVNSYIPYIQALNNSTVKGETAAQKKERVAAAIAKLKKGFEEEAGAIGFAAGELKDYSDMFDQFTTIEKKSVYDVTVNVNGMDPATRALTEFAAAANAAAGAIVNLNKTKIQPIDFGGALGDMGNLTKAQAWNQIEAISGIIENLRAKMRSAKTDSDKARIGDGIAQWYRVMQKLTAALGIKNPSMIPGFATGGYVSGLGTGTSDSIRANLSNGEFVLRASAVSKYGPDFLNALNQERVRFAPAQSAQQMGGGSGLVYLSPEDRALLRAAIDRPINLYADGTRLAQTVNEGNRVLAQRGKN